MHPPAKEKTLKATKMTDATMQKARWVVVCAAWVGRSFAQENFKVLWPIKVGVDSAAPHTSLAGCASVT